jgi:transposase
VSWKAAANILMRVVAEVDDSRLDDLYRIGIDEISYRKRHRYLLIVTDHDRDGAVVWAKEGN